MVHLICTATQNLEEHNRSHFKRISVRYCFGSVPESLQMIDNITSSAPAPIESSRMSRNIRLISTSAVYPIPPQYCRHESVSSRASRPALSFAIDASLVTSWPLRYRPGECVCVCVCVCVVEEGLRLLTNRVERRENLLL